MNDAAPNDLTLDDLAAALQRHMRIVIGVPLLMFVLAVIFLHVAERKYTVTFKVTPTITSGTSIPTALGSLADLAGFAVPGNEASNSFDLYLDGLQSREASAAIAANEPLMKQLFSSEWNSDRNEWVRPSGIGKAMVSLAKLLLGVKSPAWQRPDAARVNEYLNDELKIARPVDSPIVSISIEHTQPAVARDLLNALHQAVDPALRAKELARTTSYIEYLNDQLGKVVVTEYRQALHDIIAEQEKRRMIASSDLAFAAEPTGQPTASTRPTSPRPAIVIILSLMLGLFTGVMVAFLQGHFRIFAQ